MRNFPRVVASIWDLEGGLREAFNKGGSERLLGFRWHQFEMISQRAAGEMEVTLSLVSQIKNLVTCRTLY